MRSIGEDLGMLFAVSKRLQEESEDSNKNHEFRRNFCHIIGSTRGD